MKRISLLAIALICTVISYAQTADEIVSTYIENTGGAESWTQLESIKMTCNINANGMEIPIEVINTKDGKQYVMIELQGKQVVQVAFDGETAWSHNFMTMEAEAMDSEAVENMKRESKEFPDPFLNYKEKGYSIELAGTESVEGTECYKIKITQTPVLVDGKEEENVSYYYFDSEDYVPILSEQEIKQGEAKGNIEQTVFSDYQEVDGLYFPFSITNRLKGGEGQAINVSEIQINPDLDASIWSFPEKKEDE